MAYKTLHKQQFDVKDVDSEQENHSLVEGDRVPLDFQIVLRLRPIQKKEHEDTVVIDCLPESSKIVLHPAPVTVSHASEMTASSQLVLQTLSPETVRTQSDMEIQFDQVFPPDTSQDKVYYSLGLPMALSSMESLKSGESVRKKTHILISMGVTKCGNSFSCWGNTSFKRKSPSDGIVPRILDSLFSQSKHHVTNKSLSFVVSIIILQVDQAREGAKTKDECHVYDLLHHKASSVSSAFGFSPVKASNAVRSLVANFERNNKPSLSSIPSPAQSKATASTNEAVFVEQDPITMDFKAVNAQYKSCHNIEEARTVITDAMCNSRKLSSKKNQSHVLVQMQPILLKGGKIIQRGGIIAILDMAGVDQADKFSRTGAKRIKDAIPNRCDAHAAVMNCLRALQQNEVAHQGNDETGRVRLDALKKVPFLQHKVTMLIQPLFSKKNTDSSIVTVLHNAHISHRDYDEKKSMLIEVQKLKMEKRISQIPTPVIPEDKKIRKDTKQSAPQRATEPPITQRKEHRVRHSSRRIVQNVSDADDEKSETELKNDIPKEITNPAQASCGLVLQATSSMTYS
jgi:hypothetical protein